MSNQVLLKKSSVVAKVPTTGDLAYGEVALNYADGKLYFKNSSNTVQPLGIAYTKVIADVTAKINQGYIANTGAGSFTITLPASPETGNYVIIVDDNNFGTTPLYVARNGNPIAGQPENLTLDITGVSATLLWDGGSWNVYTQIGASGGSGSGGTQYNFGSFPQGLIPDTTNTYTLGNSTYKWAYVNSYGYRYGDNTTQTTSSNADGSSITNSGGSITAQAGGLAGNTLNSGVVYSSLQTLGTQTQRINWSGSGVAAPQFTSSSTGTKLLLYPAVSSGSADYAIGIENSTIWYGVPNNSSSYFFKWYGGTTNVATLDGTGALTLASTLAVNSPTISTTSTGTASVFNTNATTLNIGGAATTVSIGASTGNTTVNNNLVVTGNLTVNGTTQTINSTTLTVADINIELGKVASPTDTTANGGGITLKGATDKTISWDNTNANWTSSENWNLATGKVFKINNVSVLNSTTLGSGVTGSSLTSVGTITSGTWSSSFGAVSGANLTSLTAGNLTGTIPSTVLGNSTVYIGTTAVALNRASGTLALTGILSETYSGSTSGTIQLIPAAIAGTGTVITLPATTGTVVTTGDSGTVTNTMLAGSIANAKLTNSSVTIGSTSVSLGATVTTFAGLTSVTSTSFVGALTGNADTATKLATPRNINGVAFDGSAAITITSNTTNTLTIGTGLSGTSFNGSGAVTIAIDSTVATLTGSQTLTNKTLTLPTIGGTGAAFSGSTSGTTTVLASATAGTTTLTLPAATDTLVGKATTDTLTNKSISGSTNTLSAIPNSALTNSSVTIGSTSVSLGATVTTFAGLTSVTSTTFVGALTGNASTATSAATLTTPRAINGVNFDGSAAITVTADATTLTGTSLKSTVVGSSLTSVGTLTSLAVTTTTTSNALNVTYNPTATSGASILATGKDTQGGTGYFDFLKATNTTSGGTNGSKSFRINSTGNLEVVNSAYTAAILSLSDTGILTPLSISAGGTIGTNGQVLSSTGTGLQWTSAGAGSVTSVVAGTGLSGGTITTTGTIALATAYGDTTNPYASKTANYVLAAPNGSAGAPTFRALVAADLPTVAAAAGTLTGSTLASGVTASSLTSVGTLTSLVVNGQFGVGATPSYGTSGQLLQSTGPGSAPIWASLSYTANILVVAGGGGGGSDVTGDFCAAGGGAGGMVTASAIFSPGTTYTITVGAGGAGGTGGGARNNGSQGAASSITGGTLSTSTVGGGYGAQSGGGPGNNPVNGGNGGSGGGGNCNASSSSGGSGTTGQGNSGGNGSSVGSPGYGGGGGGGAGAAGSNGTSSGGGAGGIGLQSSITGSAVYYAGGGGGGSYNTTIAAGGSGGGGNGGYSSGNVPTAGSANTGGGGGGGGQNGNQSGATGGSGVVIISIPSSNYTGTTTGSPTVTTSGIYKILTFTSSGSYTA